MALLEPSAPNEVWWAFVSHVNQFLRPGDPALSDIQSGKQFAQQVFALGLNPLLEDPDLQNAKPGGWRFLTDTRSGQALSAEIKGGGDGAPRMTGLSRGPRVSLALQAAIEVRKLPDVQRNDYELRVLAIPSLLTEAFWLRWASIQARGNDLFVPFYTMAKEVQTLVPFELPDLMAILKPLGVLRKGFNDSAVIPPSKPNNGSKSRPPATAS
jgi:hypothetical protein